MKSSWPQVVVLFALGVSSCTPDRDLITDDPIPTGQDSVGFAVMRHTLYLNEFVARGSQNANEYGTNEDWFEIHNPNSFNAVLREGEWYVTDKGPEDPENYALPQCTIPSKGFLIVWCDGLATQDVFIHTNFSLSASGEHIGIYFKAAAEGIMVDDYAYPAQETDAVSTGRYPDGGPNWTTFQIPTPGSANN